MERMNNAEARAERLAASGAEDYETRLIVSAVRFEAALSRLITEAGCELPPQDQNCMWCRYAEGGEHGTRCARGREIQRLIEAPESVFAKWRENIAIDIDTQVSISAVTGAAEAESALKAAASIVRGGR